MYQQYSSAEKIESIKTNTKEFIGQIKMPFSNVPLTEQFLSGYFQKLMLFSIKWQPI